MNSGIYRVINPLTGKFYIGCSANLRSRFTSHKTTLKNGCHPNHLLQDDFNKSKSEPIFEVIEEVEKPQLLDREKFWIKYYKAISLDLMCNFTDARPNPNYNYCPSCQWSVIWINGYCTKCGKDLLSPLQRQLTPTI